jgi:hypothetical protein
MFFYKKKKKVTMIAHVLYTVIMKIKTLSIANCSHFASDLTKGYMLLVLYMYKQTKDA